MKKQWVVLVVATLFLITNYANAWDGHREGFILGLGAGYGNHWLTYESTKYEMSYYYGMRIFTEAGTETKTASQTGLMSDFKIGYAPSDQLMIYWMSKVAWLDISEKEYMITSGIGGLGISYYQEPTAPSAYFSGGVGYSTWQAPLSGNPESAIGLGLSVGAGYEFAKHISLECNLTWGHPSKKEWDWDAKALAVRVTVNVLGY